MKNTQSIQYHLGIQYDLHNKYLHQLNDIFKLFSIDLILPITKKQNDFYYENDILYLKNRLYTIENKIPFHELTPHIQSILRQYSISQSLAEQNKEFYWSTTFQYLLILRHFPSSS
jgi:hypothetical protein